MLQRFQFLGRRQAGFLHLGKFRAQPLELNLQRFQAGRQNGLQAAAQLIVKFAVAPRLGGLALQRVHLLRDFFQNVGDARQVLPRRFQLGFRQALAGFEFGNSGGFFQNQAPVRGFGTEDLADAPLLDDGIGLRTQPGSHEKVLNIAQAADVAVDQVLAFTGAEKPAGYGDFAGTVVKFTRLGARTVAIPVAVPIPIAVSGSFRFEICGFLGGGLTFRDGLCFFRHSRFVVLGIHQGHADFRHSRGGAGARTVENYVGHALAAQQARALLTQHPGDGVREIGLAATIRSHDGGNAIRKFQPRTVREGFEAQQFQFFQLVQITPFSI